MAAQTIFATEFTFVDDRDHRLLAILCGHGDLYSPLQDEKKRIRLLSLSKQFLILTIFGDSPAVSGSGQKIGWDKGRRASAFQRQCLKFCRAAFESAPRWHFQTFLRLAMALRSVCRKGTSGSVARRAIF